jgi:excisionase family DNA binding protein
MANAASVTRMPSPKTRQPRSVSDPDQRIEKLFYRRAEAAYALGLALRSIDYMIADQRLTTRRFGRSVLIPASDVRRAAAEILRSDMLQGNASGSGITGGYGEERSSSAGA